MKSTRPGAISVQVKSLPARPRRPVFIVALLQAVFICCFLSDLTAAPFPPADTNSAPEAAVLILNSYHPGYTWSDNELDGIKEKFAKAGLHNSLYVEYLDSKHFADNLYFKQLKALFAVKYAELKPALVMTLDNPAFEFAVRYRQDLFPGIPIVFTGLNDYEPAMLRGETGITGVVERQDIIGTIKAAMAIQPGLKEAVIVHDYTSSGLASRNEAQEQLTQLPGNLRLRYLPEMTIEEVVATLKQLQPGSIVLPFSFSRDKAGKVFNHAQLAEILTKAAPVPVYGTKVERLGYGIIGGSLLEGKSHGAIGADLALRILRGERAETIPVLTNPASEFIFDNNLLKRFNIDPDRLPPGSRVINVPPGIYRQHGTVINIAGGIIALLAISLALVIVANRRRNLAETALLESERNRTRELEIAHKEMESFCYAVSHDLQAPLRHIKAFSSIIEEDYGNSLDDGSRLYIARIKAASSRMGQLIKDLLTLSQISREEIARKKFDLGLLAEEVLQESHVDINSATMQIEIDREMIVYADRQLLRVVLDNLIGNALKYSAKADVVAIHIGMKVDKRRNRYFVSDNGVGFDMKYADKLFKPFHRLHEDSEFEGTGIGLATVQRVIHRHCGEVWAESVPGQGATFFFTLQP